MARKSSLLVLLPCAAVLAVAQSISPSSYSMPNGELGAGGLLYRDDLYKGTGDSNQNLSPLATGLGQLTDGMTSCSPDPSNDCGSGAGYEWVGWRHDDPTIIFGFGQRCDFKTVRIYTANRPDQGVPLWKTATISISDDGLNFRKFTIRTFTDAERRDMKARYVDVPLSGSGKFVRIHIERADANSWMLISEVAFEGKIARDQAPR